MSTEDDVILDVPPVPVVGPLQILEHSHDEAAGIYRVVIGHAVFCPAHRLRRAKRDESGEVIYESSPTPDAAEGELVLEPRTLVTEVVDVAEVVLDLVGTMDFVFDDGDERWFDADGHRRPDEEVSGEQHAEIKSALEKQAAADAKAAEHPRELPGVGEAL